jgi:hypothetical protein
VLNWDWTNLGDFEKLGVAQAEQKADARVIRQSLQRGRIAELYLDVMRQYRLVVIPRTCKEKLSEGAIRNQS